MEKKINYPDADYKYQVKCSRSDFSLMEDKFEIVIKNRYMQEKYRINKEDCLYDSDGNFYFTLENVGTGIYYAWFSGSYEDDDYDKQERVFTDVQELLEVGCQKYCACKCGDASHEVQYTEIFEVSIDGEDYLADCYGRYVYTSDGKRICFTSDKSKEIEDMGKIRMQMTGEEFLRKWESFDPNSEIDTIPELMHAMKGISDDKTVKEEIKDETEETYVEDTETLFLDGEKPEER